MRKGARLKIREQIVKKVQILDLDLFDLRENFDLHTWSHRLTSLGADFFVIVALGIDSERKSC